MKTKFLVLIFACALISTTKAESKVFTLNGLLITGNTLIAAYNAYNLSKQKDIVSSLQASIAISTISSLINNKFKNVHTIANAGYFIYFLGRAITAERKKNSEEISKERANSLIMAVFYGFTAYQLNK